jgi:hypothetical protein
LNDLRNLGKVSVEEGPLTFSEVPCTSVVSQTDSNKLVIAEKGCDLRKYFAAGDVLRVGGSYKDGSPLEIGAMDGGLYIGSISLSINSPIISDQSSW